MENKWEKNSIKCNGQAASNEGKNIVSLIELTCVC